MKTAPSRRFKANKLRFISHLVRESLLTPTRGSYYTPAAAEPGAVAITWIGHSSFLIEIGGKRVLLDPVFAKFLIVLKRRRKPGLRLRDLPPIDLILITHAHMDHLNLPSLRGVLRLNRRHGRPAPTVVVPQGVADLVARLGFAEVRSMQHWEQFAMDGLSITMTPARHWGARMFNDTGRGYGGYVISAGPRSVYHSGDSAYFPGFAEIGRRLRPEIALLPIGAYSPESFRSVHTSPEDALQAFRDLGSRVLIPMHYGTFRLSREPMDEPPRRLLAAAAQAGLQEKICILDEGRTRQFPAVLEQPRNSQLCNQPSP